MSKAVDLNEVSARLAGIAADARFKQRRKRRKSVDDDGAGASSQRSDSGRDGVMSPGADSEEASSEYDSDECERRNLEDEREYHDKLVRDGGRPAYPVGLLGKLGDGGRGGTTREEVERYDGILSFFKDDWREEPRHLLVFCGQYWRWCRFREHQRRGRPDAAGLAQLEEAMRRRLARLGGGPAQPPAFRLRADPARQDALSTWVEYFYFESLEYWQSAQRAKYHQQAFDGHWAELAGAHVLRDAESKDALAGAAGRSWEHRLEMAEAKDAVRAAQAGLLAAEKALDEAGHRSGISSQSHRRQVATAEARLEALTLALDRLVQRHRHLGDFFMKTTAYREAKAAMDRSGLLLAWILQQIPLIEEEERRKALDAIDTDQKRTHSDLDSAVTEITDSRSVSGTLEATDSGSDMASGEPPFKKARMEAPESLPSRTGGPVHDAG